MAGSTIHRKNTEAHVGKTIKHISDLPKWYSLKNYREAAQLDFQGWYWQLVARLELDTFMSHMTPHERASNEPMVRNSRELLQTIRNHPILDYEHSTLVKNFSGAFFTTPKGPGIRYASVADINAQLSELQFSDSNNEALFRNYLSENNVGNESNAIASPLIDAQPNKWFPHETLLSVSMGLPEKVLIENFTAFVRTAKTSRPDFRAESEPYRKPDFGNWINFGVLPFIDLSIWEKEEEVSISNRVMADAIFPVGEGGEEVIRKTTAKYAHQLLDANYLAAIAAIMDI